MALIPTANLGYPAIVMAIIGLIHMLGLGERLWKDRRTHGGLQASTLLLGGIILYGLQIWYAVLLLRDPRDTNALYDMVYLLVPIYSLGLARA